jgi:hypothetical protein
MKIDFSRQIFEKFSNIKFHEHSSLSAELSPVDGQTDGQAGLTKLIVAFRNFADTIRSTSLLFLVAD